MTASVRVIKVGGSLLDWPALATSFGRWLSLEPEAANVVVVGGGRAVDEVRAVDRARPLGDEAAHWAAIRAMSVTATQYCQALRDLYDGSLVRGLDELRTSDSAGVQVLDVERFLRADAQTDDALPCSWDVTSDSIAARVARRIDAAELVLLKSALPAAPESREALAHCGYVDQYFPQAAERLKVRCVNLRDGAFPQAAL